MARVVLIYACALGLTAAALQWLQYRYLVHALPVEAYAVAIAIGFAALGLWAGVRLTPRSREAGFERNEAAIRSLGLTARECEILEMLASGKSNKELARSLDVSPNTIKTHVARIYEKLDVQRRIQAIEKARWLALIPPG